MYQRDYAWKHANCQKLWDDICDLVENKRSNHFLGTLVTIEKGFQDYSVIDGQQRLTTISLLLLALRNVLKLKNKLLDEENLMNMISDFLINKYSPDQSKRIRLKPNKQDKQRFEDLFEKNEIEQTGSNIYSNYKFFYDKIYQNRLTPQQIFDAFRKLNIVLINLTRGVDDPQLIFESLNSTGVDLTPADLIRNYILMDLEYENQEVFYTKYWLTIEHNCDEVAEFIRYYLNYKLKLSVKREDIYTKFKEFVKTKYNNDKEQILKDLVKYSIFYSYLIQYQNYSEDGVNLRLERLRKLEFTVCYPYLLDVFSDLKENIFSTAVVVEILEIIESYAFRKILVNNTTQGLNKLFITLARDIKKEPDWARDYFEILKYIILEKTLSQSIPNDEEFESVLIYKEVYRLQSKNRTFLLASLENYNSAYKVDLSNLTVEHIMPQTLDIKWKARIGDNSEEIQSKYLHTLGNLTLTPQNSKLSNNDYDKKLKIDFQTSKLKLNYKIEEGEDWGEIQILHRAKILAKGALEIWKYPKTSFSKMAKEEQVFDLSDDDDFSGKKPKYLILGNTDSRLEINSWKEFLKESCKYLFNYSPTEFISLADKIEYQWYFKPIKPMNSPVEFVSRYFIESNLSANGIVGFLKKTYEEISFPPEQIQLILK